MSRGTLSVAWDGVLHVVRHPLRSALTALTCAVAIAVTVNVVSLAYGLDEDVRGDIGRFGRRTVDVGRSPVVMPGAPRKEFGEADLARIRIAVAGLSAAVVPVRQRAAAVAGDGAGVRLSVVAAGLEYPRTLDVPLVAGRWIAAAERGAEACVLDKASAAAVFPGVEPAAVLGRRVTIDGVGESRVVGVLDDPMTYRALFEAFDENRKSRALSGALLVFRNVYLPEDALGAGDMTGVSLALPDDRGVDEAARRLSALYPRVTTESVLDKPETLTTFVRRDWMETLGGTTQTGAMIGNIVWILIVLVACVMISTLNLITIRERYDELAVRRCEGARRSHVVAMVTVEGLLTSVVGGLAGLPLGYVGAALLRRLVDVPFRFDLRYAAAAVGISVALGLLSSVVPARRAAGLDPASILSRRLS